MRVGILLVIIIVLTSIYAQAQETAVHLPALRTCDQEVTAPISEEQARDLLIGTLQGTDGFGSTYLPESRIKDEILTTDQIKYFKRLGGKGSRVHHFLFHEIVLDFTGGGGSPKTQRGKSGFHRYYNFQKLIDENTAVVVQLNEMTVNGKSRTHVLLGFADAKGKDKAVAKLKLGHSGNGTVGELDERNFEHYKGKRYEYAAHKFATLHVPEEVGPRNRKWEPTGTAGFSVEFFHAADGSVTAFVSGYAVKR